MTEKADRDRRKLAAAVLAVGKSNGFLYEGDDILAEEVRNPRVAGWVRTAKAAVNAYRRAK